MRGPLTFDLVNLNNKTVFNIRGIFEALQHLHQIFIFPLFYGRL